jgi:hypothetical protein
MKLMLSRSTCPGGSKGSLPRNGDHRHPGCPRFGRGLVLDVDCAITGAHETVNHKAKEYVRPGGIHTNTVEGYYSVFKRGMRGVYQHCREKHLHRYLAEFDFRYSNRVALGVDDVTRADRVLAGIVGKRLTYRTPDL